MGNSDSKPEKNDNTVATGPTSSQEENERSSENKRRNRMRNGPPVNKITDDQIQVNLAMADLMAYLQVVANNSNHLPVTRRDDPELDRSVSSLSSEEYARKSAAFVPADIRILGGVFTRYGRVWDLPTSEEYNACDGALEPGRSYGGACCNALLKVVYDAANDNAAAQTQGTENAIFDDDEDDEDESSTFFGKSVRSGFSLDLGTSASCNTTWADLLKQMKAEFKEIGYAQVPKLTTSRKMDLSKPFALVPEDSKHGKRRSLLIGCNYTNVEDAELKASHDDIRSMKDYIVNVHSFPESPDMMTILMDDGEHKPPTFMNIIEAFKTLSEESQPGDSVFVQFSGHGGRVLDANDDAEFESYDEVLVPTDYETSGLIRDTVIFKTLLAPMRFGVTVTIIIDCCDNGMVMELPYAWSPKNDKKEGAVKLSANEDFSFVRFLKVVKTLYETSAFTQLGRTVGSALGGPLALSDVHGEPNTFSDTDDDHAGADRLAGESDKKDGSLFDALVEACSPGGRNRKTDDKTEDMRISSYDEEKKDELSPLKTETLLERVINCTLLGTAEEEEFSDEETYKTRTYDEHSEDSYCEGSFENSEDDYQERRHHKKRSTRSRRRR